MRGAKPEAARAAREAEWLTLTRETLPGLAAGRRWPVRADHCFQRILLDTVTGGIWYDALPERPAYRHMSDAMLDAAIELARGAAAGTVDLVALNVRSLAFRRARKQGNGHRA